MHLFGFTLVVVDLYFLLPTSTFCLNRLGMIIDLYFKRYPCKLNVPILSKNNLYFSAYFQN